jgi:TM2 domain-containing membrane protein YozV
MDKICPNCGSQASGAKCEYCGTQIPQQAVTNSPPKSYAAPPPIAQPSAQADDRWLILLVLSIFLGGLGVDRFYVGKVGTGILKLLITICSLGTLCWIWWIIDIILIATGKFTDSEGRAIVQK